MFCRNIRKNLKYKHLQYTVNSVKQNLENSRSLSKPDTFESPVKSIQMYFESWTTEFLSKPIQC